MNDNDLERDLRSQRGPREAGYNPAVLPMTLDDAQAPGSTPSRAGRAGLLIGVGVAGAVAVAVIAGILSGPGSGPEVGSGSTAPSAGASESTPVLPSCLVADVSFSPERWGAAAGSRGTTVSISLVEGRYACTLSQEMYAEIRDANGDLLVSGSSIRRGPISVPPVDLEPGSVYLTNVVWSNWCSDDPVGPVRLSLTPLGWTSAVSVDVPEPENAVPPCNGAGQPSSLSVMLLEPQS